MSKVISFITQKGGSGKSTIATNVAGILSAKKKVLLIDCDHPQATSASWAAIRLEKADNGNLKFFSARDNDELMERIDIKNYAAPDSWKPDYMIVDTSARITDLLKTSLVLSDLSLMPIAPSIPDIWSSTDLLEVIKEIRVEATWIQLRVIWNKFQTSTSSSHELSKLAREQLNFAEMDTKLGYRVVYSNAMLEGKTVAECKNVLAKKEINALVDEILSIVHKEESEEEAVTANG